ncbi:MAG TPA: DUF192 domain-containing protein [Candidatus Polarisedimenticolia bacterium]|nr:DUF192 domain-containing protein [Candidatus Polarisedimenticolia bacterium]
MSSKPAMHIVDGPNGKRVTVTAVVDETNRMVVAERVQRADTFMTRLIGLLGRDRLGEGEALWISPCKGIHTMGMRFPIDAVFLDPSMRVVEVRERVAPWRATRFVRGATSVLELSAGAVGRTGVSKGDQLSFLEPEPGSGLAWREHDTDL